MFILKKKMFRIYVYFLKAWLIKKQLWFFFLIFLSNFPWKQNQSNFKMFIFFAQIFFCYSLKKR